MMAMPISASLRRRATTALSKRSAISPPSADRKKYGAMNVAAASVISVSAALPPIWKRIRKTSAFFRKLSLNAEKNWHQNSGAKRRESRREFDMGVPGLLAWEPDLAGQCTGLA